MKSIFIYQECSSIHYCYHYGFHNCLYIHVEMQVQQYCQIFVLTCIFFVRKQNHFFVVRQKSGRIVEK